MFISEITAMVKTVSIDGRLVDVAEKNKLITTKYGERAIVDVVIMDGQQDRVNVTIWCNNTEIAFQKRQTLLVGDVYRWSGLEVNPIPIGKERFYSHKKWFLSTRGTSNWIAIDGAGFPQNHLIFETFDTFIKDKVGNILGKIASVGEVKDIMSDERKKGREITLAHPEATFRLPVTIWGDHAEKSYKQDEVVGFVACSWTEGKLMAHTRGIADRNSIPDHSYTKVANWVPTCTLATLPLPEKMATHIDWAKFNDTETWPFDGLWRLAGMIKGIEWRGLVVDGCPVCERESDVTERDYTCQCGQKVKAIAIFKPQNTLHATDMCRTQVAGVGTNALGEKLFGMQAGKFRLFYRTTPHQVEAMLQSFMDKQVFFDFYVGKNPNKSGKEANKFYLTHFKDVQDEVMDATMSPCTPVRLESTTQPAVMSQFETAIRFFKSASTPKTRKLVHQRLEGMWNTHMRSLLGDAKKVMDLLTDIQIDNPTSDDDFGISGSITNMLMASIETHIAQFPPQTRTMALLEMSENLTQPAMQTWIQEKLDQCLELALPASSPQNTTPTPTKSTKMNLANLNPKSLGPSFDSLVAQETSSSQKVDLLSTPLLSGDEESDRIDSETLEKGQTFKDVDVEPQVAIASEPQLSPKAKKQQQGQIADPDPKSPKGACKKTTKDNLLSVPILSGEEGSDENDGESLQKDQTSKDVNVEQEGATASEPHIFPSTRKQPEGHITNPDPKRPKRDSKPRDKH